MAGGLLDLDDPSDQWNIDPATLAQMASAAGTPTWTPSDASSGDAPADATIAPADAQPAPAAPTAPTAPPATTADTSGGFWHSLASGIGDAGLALGGGIDPSITGDAASIAGRRALLNFSLNMLANSGPSYTPRNFGQILASGLSAANQSNIQTEQTRLKAQQVAATYALKAGQQQIQAYLAKITGDKFAQESGRRGAVSGVASGRTGAPATGSAPASEDGTASAPPATPGDFVSSNAPVFQDVAARTGFPVDFVAGQAGNESGWGTSRAATQGNNLFGLSDADGKPLSFPTRQAGIDAYVNLLNSRYKDVPRTGSNTDIGTALGKAGYNMTVPDYGARVGAAADQARRLLPQPTTTAPATTAAAPGTTVVASTGATVPTGSAVAPAPSSTAPSPATTAAPIFETLPPAVLPDVAARKADIEDTYKRQMQIAVASGDKTQMAKATQDRLDNLAKLNQDVTTARASAQTALIDHNAKIAEQQRTIAATAAENQVRIQAENDRAQAERDHATQLAKIQAGYTAQQHQTDADQQVGSKQLEAMGTQAEKAETIQPMVRSLIPLLKNAPSGAVGQLLQTHPEWINTLAGAGIIKPETQTAAQLINGLTDYLSLDLKPVATGALRTQEIPMLKGLGPQLGQSTQAQQQAAARILNYAQRVKDEYDFARENFGAVDTTNGQPNYKILYKNIDAPMQIDDNGRRVGGGLGPVVPEPPPLQANPTPADLTAMRRYQSYVGNLPSGMPYNAYERQPNGSYQKVLKVQP